LELNPSSGRAHKAVEWATNQVQQAQAAAPSPTGGLPESLVTPVKIELIPEPPQPAPKSSNRKWVYAASILGLLLCAIFAFAAYSAVTHPTFVSILNKAMAPTQEAHWARVQVAKPSVTPIDASSFSSEVTATPTANLDKNHADATPSAAVETDIPTEAATPTPQEVRTEGTTATPQATETPAALAMEAVVDTPTSEFGVPTSSAPLPDIAKTGNGVRWIDVDLTNQAVYAYEGDVMVNSFIVSTGTWLTPTVTGQYNIYVKYRYANMHGPGYFLPDVPYVMYFYKGYGLHGTYWHSNFGHPMSHGCINLRTDNAGWLFDWASVGTLVNVHY
jgi:lipoprotein-anchoring transpeptidase ErfK/SrfK